MAGLESNNGRKFVLRDIRTGVMAGVIAAVGMGLLWFALLASGLSPLSSIWSAALPIRGDIVAGLPDDSGDAEVDSGIRAPEAPDGVELDWHRSRLDDDGQALYDRIEYAMRTLASPVSVGDLGKFSIKDVDKVFCCVLDDNPDVFWVRNTYRFMTDETGNVLEFSMMYVDDDRAAIEEELRQLCVVSDTVVAGVPKASSAERQLRYLYEWVANNTEYLRGYEDQDIRSVFEGRQSVCSGYSRAFQFLALRSGLLAMKFSGSSYTPESDDFDEPQIEDHTWNAAVVGGRIAFFDVTWDDRRNGGTGETYFALDYDDFCKTHIFEDPEVVPKTEEDVPEVYRVAGIRYTQHDIADVSGSLISDMFKLFAEQKALADLQKSEGGSD